jgi:uncharacterized protein YggE
MANLSVFPAGNAQSAILYSITDSEDAEHEAVMQAIADARQKALRIAKGMEKQVGAVKDLGATSSLQAGDMMGRHGNQLIARGQYLSPSAEAVEVPAKVNMTFELKD